MKRYLSLFILIGLVGCASDSIRVMELSEDTAPFYQLSFAKIVTDYEEMRSYKAQARNLKTGKVFSVGNMPSSVFATSYAVSECERIFKSQCILIKNNEFDLDNTIYEKSESENK